MTYRIFHADKPNGSRRAGACPPPISIFSREIPCRLEDGLVFILEH